VARSRRRARGLREGLVPCKGVRSRERVTCYSTSLTGIPDDYRRQHHRSDGPRSFFKRFSTSLQREQRERCFTPPSPTTATTTLAIGETELSSSNRSDPFPFGLINAIGSVMRKEKVAYYWCGRDVHVEAL